MNVLLVQMREKSKPVEFFHPQAVRASCTRKSGVRRVRESVGYSNIYTMVYIYIGGQMGNRLEVFL